jgi:hypothetical protein
VFEKYLAGIGENNNKKKKKKKTTLRERLKTTDPLGEEVFLEICTECLFVIQLMMARGAETCCEAKK